MQNVAPLGNQTTTIDPYVIPEMPPLAWLVKLAEGRPTLLCGADVEVFADGFFEGCWAGEFANQDFDTARQVFGSGGRIGAERAFFVTPSHTLDALYALRRGGEFTVSNSLAFLVQFADLELPFDFDIGARFVSILQGLDLYERVVFAGPDWTLHRIVYENFEIRSGELRTVPKEPQQEAGFADYASYRDFLLSTLRAVVRNGAAPGRKARYPLITSCSSGYDSTACTALAAQLGCDRALTLRTARGYNLLDSGHSTAAALGLEPVELERPARARGSAFEEAEFFATGMGGEDFVFLGFAPHCRRRMLLTGFHGDMVWDRHAKPANNLKRKDASGSTLTELRLRHGFVQVPVPFIGATRHDVLLKIANSKEMEPYQVGGHYDRPIPRRIAEEAGLRRGTFADAKKAGSITFALSSMFWSPRTLQDLRKFEQRALAKQGIGLSYNARSIGRTTAQFGVFIWDKSVDALGISHFTKRILRTKRIFRPAVQKVDKMRYNHPRYSSLAFLWAVDKVRTRYPTEEVWRVGRERSGVAAVA